MLVRGGDFAEVYWEHTVSQSLFLEEGRLERLTGGEDLGVGLRLVKGGRTYYAHTNSLERDALLQLADKLARGAEGASVQAGRTPPAGAASALRRAAAS